MRAPRSIASLAAVALGLAGCNALLGLGDTPTAEEGETTATSATGIPATTGAGGDGPAPASSGGGGDDGAAGGGGRGAGGEGAGGAGGGAPAGPPCGPCDDDAACGPGGACTGGACSVRVVPLEGGATAVEGIAASPTTVVVGVVDGPATVTFHFVDRATWSLASTAPLNVPGEGVLAPGPDVRAHYAPNGSAVVLPVEPAGLGASIAVPGELRGLTFDPGPTPAGSLLGVARNDGRVFRVDLDDPAGPCLLAGAQDDAAADLAVRRDGSGEVTALAWSLGGALAAPARVETSDPVCDGTDEIRIPIEGVDAVATIALGGGFTALQVHRVGDPGGAWSVWSSSLDAATRPTNGWWGLTADGDGVLVPGAEGGLERCDEDLTACSDAAPAIALGAVQNVALDGAALLITDLDGSAARLVCVDRTGSAPP